MLILTESQRLHIIELLENGEELPIDYKHLLFPPERQEYELVYAAKEREEDILAETMAVPLQPIRSFGGDSVGWHNMLIFGDNLQAMKTLLNMKEKGQLCNADGSPGVKLIYIDPPFATKRDFQGGGEERAYQDKVAGAQFLEFLRRRLLLAREILANDGTIWIHLDYRMAEYIKVLCDELFVNCHLNTIFWRSQVPRGAKVNAKYFPKSCQQILVYKKRADAAPFWQAPKREIILTSEELAKEDSYRKDEQGWFRTSDPGSYTYDSLLQFNKANRLYVSHDGVVIFDEDKKEVRTSKGKINIKYYAENIGNNKFKITRAVDNIWTDIPGLGTIPSEEVGYPTQKTEGLLKRIIECSTRAGDIVLDFFVGSGTTAAVAEKSDRRWIGIDRGKLAIYTIQKRMLNLKNEIGNRGKLLKPKPFTLYNAGLYDFARLRELSWEGWRSYALGIFQCQDKPHKISGRQMDGIRGSDEVLVFNHRLGGGVVLDYGYIEELHSQVGSRVGMRFYIIAPAASVTFLEDYIERGRTRYYILRIPYSIINELHSRNFSAIVQPVNETQVNETVESVGFDFVRQPKVECEYSIRPQVGKLYKHAVVKIKTFKSQAMAKGASQKGNLETLSIVMVDYNYPYDPARIGKELPPPFEVDKVFYASEVEASGWEVQMPLQDLQKYVMLIYVDIYGNEYTEVKALSDFLPGPAVIEG